ncbi:DoxX family protein [Candidatus Nitrosocosmicus agrestis]|jgi:putative oxidoreductase|uniref:DoxX family protein n=1 Tax=Candidatus Nitrosocosmicus agrestis TaxID=2563600 RepID=UPI00122DDAD0|nr:DoxX family protein [Candidatus Nitrosocosmicus sp. SS]KAA2282163.1 DoxX family protein [Candidatus Nitrosocosmicus sp. SS]KAF0869991.1 DoxX family protein [Candidatus Nitrosocosmicus sp. SS]
MQIEKISAFSPLPIRIMAGVAFILHGMPKFNDLLGTQGFFASVGIPADLALLIGLLEVIGGILLIVGLVTRVVAILFAVEMMCAILIVKAGNSFMGQGGFEVDLLLMSISISLAISGPGRLSIEKEIIKREIFPKISYKKR